MELEPIPTNQSLTSQSGRPSSMEVEDDIQLTRQITKSMDTDEVFSKAKQHLMDALNYR